MPTNDAFARGFVDLLRTTEFPSRFSGEDILQQTHIVVTALANALSGVVGTKFTTADLAAQGGHVGGGPHRLDLLVHYSLASGAQTQEITQGFLP